jgi:hypothetical protein
MFSQRTGIPLFLSQQLCVADITPKSAVAIARFLNDLLFPREEVSLLIVDMRYI